MSNNNDRANVSCVGVITDAYHMQGLVKIKTFTSKPENITKLKCIDEEGRGIVIAASSIANVFRIQGITTRTEAEKIIGTKFYVKLEDLPQIDSEEEFYMEELVNIPVCDMEDNHIGVIKGCFNFGAGDILEIRFVDGKEEMYLFTRENFPEVSRKFVRLDR